jgi:hypothetical protein
MLWKKLSLMPYMRCHMPGVWWSQLPLASRGNHKIEEQQTDLSFLASGPTVVLSYIVCLKQYARNN